MSAEASCIESCGGGEYQQFHRSSTVVPLSRAEWKGTVGLVKTMLIAAFIFVISVAALVQFAVFTWRAGFLQVASQPLPNQAEIAFATRNMLQSNNFEDISAYQQLCPEVG